MGRLEIYACLTNVVWTIFHKTVTQHNSQHVQWLQALAVARRWVQLQYFALICLSCIVMFEVGFLSETSKVDLQQIGAGLQTRMELVIEDPVMGKVSGFPLQCAIIALQCAICITFWNLQFFICNLQYLSLTPSVKLVPIAFVLFTVVVFDGFFIF